MVRESRSGPQLMVEEARVEGESHPERGVLRWGRNKASPRAETPGTWRYVRWTTRDLQATRLCGEKKRILQHDLNAHMSVGGTTMLRNRKHKKGVRPLEKDEQA